MSIRSTTAGDTPVGFVGLGVMGASMATNLLAAGFELTVTTRTRATAEPVLAAGARWADTPREVAAGAAVVITMVGYPADVREVILGADGALAGAAPGTILVDMTTSEPSLAQEVAAAAAAQGVHAVDAPVSGGDVGARNGTLSIMVGGEPEVVAALDPVWQVLGSTIVHQGPAGAGQHTKAVNQVLVAGGMIGITEALLYAHRAGLDLDTVLASVSSGAAGSWALSNLAPRVIRGDFQPGFYVEHFVKDMGIALAEAERMRLPLPGLALVRQLYLALLAQGRGRLGTQSLVLALSELAGEPWPASQD